MQPRTVLLVVLPHRMYSLDEHSSKKTIRGFLAFPYGCLTIASYLKNYASNLGQIEVLDLNLPALAQAPSAALEQKLSELKPDVVGFSMSYDISYTWLKALTAVVRGHNAATCIVAGGPAVTTAYEEILSGCDLDACCYSEGEVAMKNLIEAEDLGVAIAADPWVTKAKLKAHQVYDDLDKIVDVDYSFVDVGAYSMEEAFSPHVKSVADARQFFIVTSRGCPFKCVFCAEPTFHGAGMRYVSVDKVVEHVARLQDKYGLNILTIYDDQILMNKPRAKELFARLAAMKIRVEMPNGVTLSYIDEEMAALMRAAGVDTLFLAIEHGSYRVLKDIIKKPIAYNRIKPTIQLLQRAGIYCMGFFVIGLPGETRAERQETRDAIVDWGLDWSNFNYATPLRGSELYRMCREKGWIDPKHLPIGAIDMTEYVITAPGMDKDEIESFVFDANLDVNFVNNRNMRVGRYDVARSAFREVIGRHPGQAFAHYYLDQCGGLGLYGGGHYERYCEIITEKPIWRAAAERFGLEVLERQYA